MLNCYSFLRIYEDIAFEKSNPQEVKELFWDLQKRLPFGDMFEKWFSKSEPDKLDQIIAIDAVAHQIHAFGNDVLQSIYPGSDYKIFKATLDKLAGMEKSNEVRRLNRGFYTSILQGDGLFLLEKQEISPQAGMTTREAIADAIDEYKRLYDAGIASPAEIATLGRYYSTGNPYQEVMSKWGPGDEPMVVGGPASVEMIDKENHLITVEALKDAFEGFMRNFRLRNSQLLHSDAQVGWILPAYINASGQIYRSGVDGKGLWAITELRKDELGDKVVEKIKSGIIKSYSIAGSAKKVQNLQKGGQDYKQVDSLSLVEITLCLAPESKIWTKKGLIEIKDVVRGDVVYTHKNHYRPVVQVMKRDVAEKLVVLTTENGNILKLTAEHPVRTLQYNFGGKRGASYMWLPASQLKIGDLVSSHTTTGNCNFCGSPLFKKLKVGQRNFCNEECRYSAIGNRTGKTIASGDFGALKKSLATKGITKLQNPKLSGGIKSFEGRERQRKAVTSLEFKKKRSNSQKEYILEHPEFRERMSIVGKRVIEERKKNPEEYQRIMYKMTHSLYRRGKFISREERKLSDLLDEAFPNTWKFVGDWKLVIGGKCPDFIFGNKIIELFGDYWHKPGEEGGRIEHFNKFGYECLVIWTHEMINTKSLVSKVEEFVGNSLTKIISILHDDYVGSVYNLEVEEDNSYTTEAMVVHNCERGMNQGAVFDILKSDEEPKIDLFAAPKLQKSASAKEALGFWLKNNAM